MFKNNNTLAFLVGGGTALALAMGAMIGAPLLQASAQSLDTTTSGNAAAAAVRTVFGQSNQTTAPDVALHGRGFGGENATYLADALGITVEELQAAQGAAFEQALQQAVKDGLITETQAQAIRDHQAQEGGTPHGFGRGFKGLKGQIDFDALLANELGITVEKLQAARETAQTKALEAAVANGDITQEQADQIKVAQTLRSYMDREALMAQALGMTTDELQAAREKGQTLTDLLTAQGLTQEQFQTAMTDARSAAVAQAVKDGVVTQEQADAFLANAGDKGFGPGGGHHGPHGGHGGGGFGPFTPGENWQTTPPDQNTDPTVPTSVGGDA